MDHSFRVRIFKNFKNQNLDKLIIIKGNKGGDRYQ